MKFVELFTNCSPVKRLKKKEQALGKLQRDPAFVAHLKEVLGRGFVTYMLNKEDKRVIKVIVNHRTFYAFISNSIPVSFCQSSLQRELRLPLIKESGLSVPTIGGGCIDFKGYTEATLTIGEMEVGTKLLVSHVSPFDLMLGKDVIDMLCLNYGPFHGITTDYVYFGSKRFVKVNKKPY